LKFKKCLGQSSQNEEKSEEILLEARNDEEIVYQELDRLRTINRVLEKDKLTPSETMTEEQFVSSLEKKPFTSGENRCFEHIYVWN